eukprot:389417-Pyramimonas_sp.AAC.1
MDYSDLMSDRSQWVTEEENSAAQQVASHSETREETLRKLADESQYVFVSEENARTEPPQQSST